MYSSRRNPYLSTTSSFSSFSSNNSYMPTYRRSPPEPLRQLVIRDLDQMHSTNWNPSPASQRQSSRIPSIPRPSVHIPRDDRSWTTDSRLTPVVNISPIPSPNLRPHVSERPFYQIVAPASTPPSPIRYQSVPIPPQPSVIVRSFRRIRRKKYVQEKTPGLCTTLCSGGFASVAALIYLVLALALPVTKLTLGILHVRDCPVNENIPIYMIVSGAAGLALVLFLLLSSTCSFCRASTTARKSTHRFMVCTIALARGMQGVIAIFLFVWFFIGNFWVFDARQRVQTDRPLDPNYCHPSLYWFAFYVLIFTYVSAIFLCLLKFCTNFLCCGACDIWKRAFS